MAPSSGCPPETVLLDFVQGRLGAEAEEEVDRHLEGCSSCRLLLAAVAAGLGGAPASAGLEETLVEGERARVSSSDLVGAVLGGTYRLEARLGAGGMGEVYEAEHLRLGRKVAIKVLRAELRARGSAAERFHREARAAAACGHPAIVDVHDTGEEPGGELYIVMERLVGESLGERLAREGRLEPETAAFLACQALSGLDAAHGAGVVHRDLKPENLFLVGGAGRLPTVKLLDFGLAKHVVAGSDEGRLTRTGTVLGTPHYLSPEQARSAPAIDGRADIYALGVVLYRSLGGRLPFLAETADGVLRQILHGEPTPLEELAPNLPPGLAPVVRRAMAREPADRFPSAAAMLDALMPLLSPSAARCVPRPGREAEPEPPPAAPGRPPREPARRRRPLAWAAAGALLVAAAGALAFFWTRDRAGEPDAALRGEVAAPRLGPSAREPGHARELVTVTLEGLPEGARVVSRGGRVEGSTVTFPRSPALREVRIEAEGFEPFRRMVAFDRERNVRVTMRPIRGADGTVGGDAGPRRGEGPAFRGDGRPDRPRFDTTFPAP